QAGKKRPLPPNPSTSCPMRTGVHVTTTAAMISSARATVRLAVPGDEEAVVGLAAALWPREKRGPLRRHLRGVLAGKPPSTLPLVIFVAEEAARVIGFVEVGLRSHADGCDGHRPVGFLEGWYVIPARRRHG